MGLRQMPRTLTTAFIALILMTTNAIAADAARPDYNGDGFADIL